MVTKPIKVSEEVIKLLESKKVYQRETYNDTLEKILNIGKKEGKKQ